MRFGPDQGRPDGTGQRCARANASWRSDPSLLPILAALAGAAAAQPVPPPVATANGIATAEEALSAAAQAQAEALTSSPERELREAAAEAFEVIPRAARAPTGNIMTQARIDLGAMLFFGPRMSRPELLSCQSCHNVEPGGVDGLETSIGHGWRRGRATPPPC